MKNRFGALRNIRLASVFAYDSFVAALSFFLALCLRFETFDINSIPLKNKFAIFLASELTLILFFILNGLYQGIWRFSSIQDLERVIRASFFGVVTSLVIVFLSFSTDNLPRSLYPIQFLLLVFFLGGGRFFYRFIKDRAMKSHLFNKRGEQKVLIWGGGEAGARLIREISSSQNLNYNVVGILDDDPLKMGRRICGIKVIGQRKDLENIIKSDGIEKIFVAIPSLSGVPLQEILEVAKNSHVEIKILPRMDHLLNSRSEISLLRNINVEDLLVREPVRLDLDYLKEMLVGKTILITGAGGSIGSELCMQIARFNPRCLVLYDSSEFNLYQLEMELNERFMALKFEVILGNVKDREKLENVFKAFHPHLTFHAAAYKHVPMIEKNPDEAITNNIMGTKNVASLSGEYNCERFVLISTDKAVNPTNVMGASKRIAEMICTSLGHKYDKTKFMVVRFGNVLGSNGSVIPLFRKQIEERKDVTVTHPDVVRYFMSIPEACQLVLQAGSMGAGGEIFVLDMGSPVRIYDLAVTMIQLAGLIPGEDINIVYTGLRPGEKLFEELFTTGEDFELTAHGKIRKAKFRLNMNNFEEELKDLLTCIPQLGRSEIISRLCRFVPEFTPEQAKH